MTWHEVRKAYPHRWVVIEALTAHSEDDKRILDDVAVLEALDDGTDAWSLLGRLKVVNPQRELYPLHTDREIIDIRERVEPIGRGIRFRK